MKKYQKEIIILIIQFLLFYIYPLIAKSPIGMVLVMINMTFIISVIIGIISKEKIKYLYPLIVALIFLPTVFIYYNSSALIHSFWYLVVSTIGLLIGCIFSLIKRKK